MASRANLDKAVDKFLGIEDDDDKLPTPETDANEQDQGTTTEAADKDGTQEQPAVTGQPDAGTGDKPSKQPSSEQPAQRQPDTQGQPTQQGRLPANNKGDLIDPSTGAVIARAGTERRLFEQNRTLMAERQTVQQEMTRLRGQVEAFQQMQQMPQQLGLTNDEVVLANRFMAAWKANPVQAATNMLAQLRGMGYEIEGLGSAVDTAALQKMVKDTIAPFVQDREAVQRENEIASAVDREINEARGRFPWLDAQEEAIKAVLDADQTLTLREAAYVVQSWAAQNGYDLHAPLAQQHAARRASTQQQTQQPAPTAPARPDGARSPSPTGGGMLEATRPGAATSHATRSRDIVLESMREAGLNVEHLM